MAGFWCSIFQLKCLWLTDSSMAKWAICVLWFMLFIFVVSYIASEISSPDLKTPSRLHLSFQTPFKFSSWRSSSRNTVAHLPRSCLCNFDWRCGWQSWWAPRAWPMTLRTMVSLIVGRVGVCWAMIIVLKLSNMNNKMIFVLVIELEEHRSSSPLFLLMQL